MTRILAALAAVLFAGAAAAQYPNKPIRLIVPFPPGGAAELGARIYALPLGQALGQPVVIETKPGADGAIAAEAAMKAAPDGYTLFYATNTAFSWLPAVRKNPPYDPIADFTPVSLVGQFGFFIFTHPSVPANTIGELLAYIRANPGKLNYGSGNSTSMLATAQLVQQEKLDVVHIPYKGDGPLSVDLLGGRVHFAIATPGTAAPQVREGKLRVLATLLPSRSPLLPEAPTLAEAGMRPLSITPWGGVFGPANMPKEVVSRVGRELGVVLKRPDVREAFQKLAFEPRSSTPEELTAFVKEQGEVFRRVVAEVGIKPE
ncbi:MAG TPA: tripartite tricarboxylate transporter substrate binding protein [Burkholderiales bacterium]|jgi:tripartite-type tricarboxylate transporter receptor subunit TctC|nr:tripartite tricarboxylate transporter substrate binding protein [Burkholderiales bacterium]